jgi:pimeloyl-ACP methyl ester carboxylesterase
MRDVADFIYLHGGPGLNSYPEKKLLSPYFEKHNKNLTLWNEPRNFKTTDYYREIKQSVYELINAKSNRIHILAHSFGAYIILDLLSEISNKLDSVTFLSPAVDLVSADDRIIKLGHDIHKKSNPEMAKRMEILMPKLTREYDKDKLDCLLLAFESGYFIQNFSSQQSFEKYFSYLTGEYEFRLEDFLKIKPSITPLNSNPSKVDIECYAFFGDDDPIFKKRTEMPILEQFFKKVNAIELAQGAHYPHIDAQEEIFKFLFEKI